MEHKLYVLGGLALAVLVGVVLACSGKGNGGDYTQWQFVGEDRMPGLYGGFGVPRRGDYKGPIHQNPFSIIRPVV